MNVTLTVKRSTEPARVYLQENGNYYDPADLDRAIKALQLAKTWLLSHRIKAEVPKP